MALIENRGQGDIFCLSTFFYEYLCKNGYYGVRNGVKESTCLEQNIYLYLSTSITIGPSWCVLSCLNHFNIIIIMVILLTRYRIQVLKVIFIIRKIKFTKIPVAIINYL